MDDMQTMARRIAIASGVSDAFRQEGRQEGWQEGRQEGTRSILEFLKNGHTLEEAEKEFALT